MSLVWVASLLLVLAAALIVAEIVLPLHGSSLLGAFATLLVCVVICFSRSVYAGLGAITAIALLTPFLLFWFIRIWPSTPVGRRLVLRPSSPIPGDSVDALPSVGLEGLAVSQLRPAGICEFSGVRLRSTCQSGLVTPGSRVRITGYLGDLPIVEPA